MISPPLLWCSTAGRAKHSNGELLLRLSTKRCRQLKVALRRPVEAKQYVLIKYTERLAEGGVEPSVGSVGDSYDNALAETVNGLYKTEVILRCGPWRSFEVVEFATFEWVDWFNNRRQLGPICHIPPVEAEERYLRYGGSDPHGGLTPAKQPPTNPGRFTMPYRVEWIGELSGRSPVSAAFSNNCTRPFG